ncbi:Toll-like receptor Tollo, partial [Gryllus bimaculatus]
MEGCANRQEGVSGRRAGRRLQSSGMIYLPFFLCTRQNVLSFHIGRQVRWALESVGVPDRRRRACLLAEARGFEAACGRAPPAHAWRGWPWRCRSGGVRRWLRRPTAPPRPSLYARDRLQRCPLPASPGRATTEAALRSRRLRLLNRLAHEKQAKAENKTWNGSVSSATLANRYNFLSLCVVCVRSGGDRSWVLRTLAPLLEAPPARYRLCLHERDFALGSLIVDNIARAIERSRRVVVVLSQHFVSSKLGQLERRTLPRHLRFLMDTRTYLEWPDATAAAAGPPTATVRESAQRRLREALGPSLRERRRPRPRPRPQPALARSVLPIEDAAVCPPRAEQSAVFAIEDVKSSARNGDGSRSKKQIPAIEDGSVERTYR